ncbi:hypothetical protein ART_3733 [Arthrobacter sp. PAMC 25486]|uniref:TetR/AcrR family transcriptional regulator n=1 Tax=Arthrobacter sp. PAMC 25486 TaxID=1494608 RepID=UPI000536009D|nr:TetR/AcrR family transcriptional regulator [Arthrobacter sp. PAMC 25486]AIY03332.1 hypothetical protein ART_3733 [Arthrobacter sp. PAMC 25486]
MTHVIPKSSGRPQDDKLTEQILAETLRLVQTAGYMELRIEQIAAAVGCGKSTIYRRWANKDELMAAALVRNSKMGAILNSGSVVEDLIDHAWQNAENQLPGPNHVAPHALWAALVVPEVREIFARDFLRSRRGMGLQILQAAIEHGQLAPEADPNAILDLLAGFTLQRMVISSIGVRKTDYRPIVEALVANPPLRANDGP